MYVTTPITTLATTAVKASMDFESAFADVRKVTNATEEEFAQLSGEIKESLPGLPLPPRISPLLLLPQAVWVFRLTG